MLKYATNLKLKEELIYSENPKSQTDINWKMIKIIFA